MATRPEDCDLVLIAPLGLSALFHDDARNMLRSAGSAPGVLSIWTDVQVDDLFY